MIRSDPVVGIVMGSDSDVEIMKETENILKEFKIPSEMVIASAHRTPEKVSKYAIEAEKRGLKIIIAGAGYAAHLTGAIAAHTTLPVIGVPLEGSPLSGFDSLLSMVQMPGGIPVATVTVGRAGAANAAILAIEILALSDGGLKKKLKDYRAEMAKQVGEKDSKLR